MLPLSGVLKTMFLILASVVFWGTIVTLTQIVGCFIATTGLLYYSVGKEKLHSLLFSCCQYPKATEQGVNPRRFAKRKFAIMLVLLSVSAGAIGGGYAGYSMEWDPRVYWYSAQRLTGATWEGSVAT
jgi:hypothetical protein